MIIVEGLMVEADLRNIVAGLTIVFILWIAGYAIFSSLQNRVKAVAVSARQTTPWQRILLLTAIIFDGYLIARVWLPSLDQWVYAQPSPAPLLAIAVMLAGGGLMVLTHLHMGASWRIGVPQDGGDIAKLITSGPHGFSRNPIYLGIMAMLAGATIAAPGPLTIGGLIVTFIGMQSIIAEEEAYLERQFDDDYAAYKKRVRRWV
jgi:protein-S-isoprenylcysteine O-methyltransferase Ste14